jgi:tellurite resistance-related uncharacterized protein
LIRTIDGFRQDDVGDWVAELSCLHGQHVRHQPPFRDRSWVLSPEGRAAHVGAALECPLCDRAELPEGLVLARTAGPFTDTTLPAALRREHRVAEHTWGVLRVLGGSLDFEMATDPPINERFHEGHVQPIPPGVVHRIGVIGPLRVQIDFLT